MKKENLTPLDRTDKKILNLLQHNSKLSNLELAEAVGLSPTPCARRVKRLEDEGIIIRQITLVDPEKLGFNLTVFVGVEMDRHTHDRFKDFEQAIAQMPEIHECHLITGQNADFLLKVIVKDMPHYEDFLLHKLTHLGGVRGVHSSFVLRNLIDSKLLNLM
ncbi:MAG: Lrp/AsnC family transcriptional regulator [Cellvibrionales bacterium]|nr:Lrp/AsnC family transcriptional regulator [Cellvibrionales bacterium]